MNQADFQQQFYDWGEDNLDQHNFPGDNEEEWKQRQEEMMKFFDEEEFNDKYVKEKFPNLLQRIAKEEDILADEKQVRHTCQLALNYNVFAQYSKNCIL